MEETHRQVIITQCDKYFHNIHVVPRIEAQQEKQWNGMEWNGRGVGNVAVRHECLRGDLG